MKDPNIELESQQFEEELTLEELLTRSPTQSFTLLDEDREWLEMQPANKSHSKGLE